MLGSNPGLLRLRHWQSDGLVTRLDLIHQTENAQILFIDQRRALLKLDSVAKAALFGFFVTFIFAANKEKKFRSYHPLML
jgi:hypothetical protein